MSKHGKRNIAFERHQSLSRRQVLRGLGACITLPTLLSASPAFAKAVAKKAAPTRMAFVYVPNGAIPAAWWPSGDGGADFELSPTLAPLAKVRNQLQVISGLTDVSARIPVPTAPVTMRARAALSSPVCASRRPRARTSRPVFPSTRWLPTRSATRPVSPRWNSPATWCASPANATRATPAPTNTTSRGSRPTSRWRPSTIRSSPSSGCSATGRAMNASPTSSAANMSSTPSSIT